MYFALCHPSDLLDLSAEQLQHIPKVVLLRVYDDYIDYVWNKLPQRVKVDSEVRTYRRCDEHYNQPWQRTHIDGPVPKIKDCTECQRRAATRREHDIVYSCSTDLTDRHAADKVLADKAQGCVTARDSALSERAAADAVWAAMKTKTKFGMGMKPKKKTTWKKTAKKRILPTRNNIAKRGGMLPFLPMLGALGSLIEGAAGVAKGVNDSKAAQRQLEELQRHDRAMEQGRGPYFTPHKYGLGLYLNLYKRGQGVAAKKKKETAKETIKMFSGATTNVQLDMLASLMRVSYFRGVFMHNALPTSGAR
ncbi:hypothetical protein ALC57_02687 [Trachymyrmex cornetzi]|uniref:Uncharacterized protein n=1 Tax=Trachymyrmex cornetzi TaxID=471704 RepID=A0A151JNH1_9HYME|nr:hypothetical protein ALC57_02687 [Trachymyrmex cornetzi]